MYLPAGWKAIPRHLVSDERVLRVGAPAFGLYVALALAADDLGNVRGDPRQLSLLTFGSRRTLREYLPKLVKVGLIRPFIVPQNHKFGTCAPEQDMVKNWALGRSDDGHFLVWFWLRDVLVTSLSRRRYVAVTSPLCPRSWLIAADLDDFCQQLVNKVLTQNKSTEVEYIPSNTDSPRHSPHESIQAEVQSILSGENKEVSDLDTVQELFKLLTADSQDAAPVTSYIRDGRLTESQRTIFDASGKLPESARLRKQLIELLQVRAEGSFEHDGKSFSGLGAELLRWGLLRAVEKRDPAIRLMTNRFLFAILATRQSDEKKPRTGVRRTAEQDDDLAALYKFNDLPKDVPIDELVQDKRFDADELHNHVSDAVVEALLAWTPGVRLIFGAKTLTELCHEKEAEELANVVK